MNSPIAKGLVITVALGILSNLSAFAVLFAELFGGVFRDKEMPIVIGIKAGVASLICFLLFVGQLGLEWVNLWDFQTPQRVKTSREASVEP